MRFLGLSLADRVPNASSIWNFREALTRAEIGGLPSIEALFAASMRALGIEMRNEWRELVQRIEALNGEFKDHVRTHEAARRLIAICGIGVLNATALTAGIGDGSAFGRGRDLAAWLGLVPRQVSTGGRPKLLGITRRGNKYLRMLFIHGVRAALPSLARSARPLGQWLRGLMARAHRNLTVVALAAKLARVAWATLRRNTNAESAHGAAA